jgi:putative DNA primase/helicase
LKRKVDEARRQAKEQRKREQAAAAAKARERIEQAPAADPSHPYLKTKAINPHGARQDGDLLLIPMVSEAGKLLAVQTIDQDGDKMFWPSGCTTKGAVFKIGSDPVPGEPILIAEGFATGAAIHEATGHQVIVAFNAGNLEHHDHPVILCADDDAETEGNPGITKATAAAQAIGGKLAVPGMAKKADFWDLRAEQGGEAVQAAVAAAVEIATGTDHQDGEAGAEGWSDPLPIVQHETSTPYPLEALPPIIGSAVQEIVQFVQCPVALAASSVLSIVSTAGQALADVQRDEGLEGPISLYFETVGDSGERKTTVDNLSARALRQWDLEAAAANKPVMDQYEMDLAAWQAERDGQLLAIKDAKKRGEDTSELKEQLQALAAMKPERPKQPRLQLEDTTAEATAEVLVQQWPTGGLLSNEGGAVLGGHSMRRETVMANLALLNTLWDGGTRRQDRKTAGSYTVRGVRLTLGIAIQEATARAFLDGPGALARGIGFLARFLFSWPESTQGTRLYREPPASWPCLNRFHERVRELLDRPLPLADDGTLDPLLLKLSPEAKSAWIDFYNEVEQELRPGREMAETRDVASKAADNVARMAALFHLFEGDTGHHIGVEHINRASAIVTWHLYEARRFLGEIAVPVEVRHAEQLEAWLVQQCNANGSNRVDRSFILTSGPNPTRRKAPLDAALKELFEAGRVRSIKLDRKAIVEVNPALLAGRGDHGAA